MEGQEKKLIADIKEAAKDNQMDTVKIMAKDLVRTRRYINKLILMKAKIQALGPKVKTLRSQKAIDQAMAQAMLGLTRALKTMNRELDLSKIQIEIEYMLVKSDIMDMEEDIINDPIDDAMVDEEARQKIHENRSGYRIPQPRLLTNQKWG